FSIIASGIATMIVGKVNNDKIYFELCKIILYVSIPILLIVLTSALIFFIIKRESNDEDLNFINKSEVAEKGEDQEDSRGAKITESSYSHRKTIKASDYIFNHTSNNGKEEIGAQKIFYVIFTALFVLSFMLAFLFEDSDNIEVAMICGVFAAGSGIAMLLTKIAGKDKSIYGKECIGVVKSCELTKENIEGSVIVRAAYIVTVTYGGENYVAYSQDEYAIGKAVRILILDDCNARILKEKE
ncbi:MAG: hypothetical protein K2O95_02345, partial [Clostridia bacterium]|nr:hypothetical protein [Clostridia bacterium]